MKPMRGIDSLIGEKVTLFGNRYIYTGVLVSVFSVFEHEMAELTEAGIVMETAGKKSWRKLSHNLFVRLSLIESFSSATEIENGIR